MRPPWQTELRRFRRLTGFGGNVTSGRLELLQGGAVTRDQAREVYLESVETGRTPAEIVAEHGYAQLSDESELRVLAEAVIDANPKAAADYRSGKKQAMQALMAELRKRAPHANPKVANELLLKLLA